MELELDKRHRNMIVLWFALLFNIAVLFLVSVFAGPPVHEADTPRQSFIIAVITAVGTFLVVISFVVKRKLLEHSVDNQNLDYVQKALIVACAMCEVCAVLGMLELFLIGTRDYFVLFAIAAIGTAFHFPRREQLLAATYKITDRTKI
jgi:hypothetical protein